MRSDEEQRVMISALREPMLRLIKPALDEFCAHIKNPYDYANDRAMGLVDSCVDYSCVVRDALLACGIDAEVRGVEYRFENSVAGDSASEHPSWMGNWRTGKLGGGTPNAKGGRDLHAVIVTGPDDELLDLTVTQLLRWPLGAPMNLDGIPRDWPRHFWDKLPPSFVCNWSFHDFDMSEYCYDCPDWKPMWRDVADTLAGACSRIIRGQDPDLRLLPSKIPKDKRHGDPWGRAWRAREDVERVLPRIVEHFDGIGINVPDGVRDLKWFSAEMSVLMQLLLAEGRIRHLESNIQASSGTVEFLVEPVEHVRFWVGLGRLDIDAQEEASQKLKTYLTDGKGGMGDDVAKVAGDEMNGCGFLFLLVTPNPGADVYRASLADVHASVRSHRIGHNPQRVSGVAFPRRHAGVFRVLG